MGEDELDLGVFASAETALRWSWGIGELVECPVHMDGWDIDPSATRTDIHDPYDAPTIVIEHPDGGAVVDGADWTDRSEELTELFGREALLEPEEIDVFAPRREAPPRRFLGRRPPRLQRSKRPRRGQSFRAANLSHRRH